MTDCPFCSPDKKRIFFEGPGIYCLWDGFPVTDGHALVIPTRHFSSWFEATQKELKSLTEGITLCRDLILERHSPLGFNIGINIGEAAGQSVPHLHIHLIPRYSGDVEDPIGGVRNVIPDKGNYLASREIGNQLKIQRAIIYGTDDAPLYKPLLDDLSRSIRLDAAVAFVTKEGLDVITGDVSDMLDRGGRLRFLTGDYFKATDPKALAMLLDWKQSYGEQCDIRFFMTDDKTGFHPKAFLLHTNLDHLVAYIGSSNLTRRALLSGIEWNQRLEGSSRETESVSREFEKLFHHRLTKPLDQQVIDDYSKSREIKEVDRMFSGIDISTELVSGVPEPNAIQQEALKALQESRERGHKAGLVVLATGLGKTWLSAFDSEKFDKVLFVAHREEILSQAQATFTIIRPNAKFGRYGGGEYEKGVDVLFASVQTLGKQSHLEQFARRQFDYIVVDEFHHAAAKTYRRLIDYFEAEFLLGLTATPERSDGADLLSLCGEHLVFRCDMHEGISRDLLSPFHYFGVPDEIDFTNIPWRNGKFDPTSLETAVATTKRAQNALEQWQDKGQSRTLAFCVSQRHADFMSEYFNERGVRSVAVHAGPASAPRTQSLKSLEIGHLDVVFAVDMFNEGLDVPEIDTVMMLRPTESKVLWLQQLGRGLRKSDGKTKLNVVDYIGNHRTFLQAPMLLMPSAGNSPGEIRRALDMLVEGEIELPPGCEVVYELEAINLLKSLIKTSNVADQITYWYRSFAEINGRRPTANEAWHGGYDPGSLRKGYGSWFGFVKSEGGLSKEQETEFNSNREFIEAFETTQMTASFKMLVLQAMIAEQRFPFNIELGLLADQVIRIVNRIQVLHAEFGDALREKSEMEELLKRNPIKAWVGGKGTGGHSYFSFEENKFGCNLDSAHPALLSEMIQELTDYRLSQYIVRLHGESRFAQEIICRVSHSAENPILFLPQRDKNPGIPEGWFPVKVDSSEYEANFVKIAINVMRKVHSKDKRNILGEVLKGFFGEGTGMSGTSDVVRFSMIDGVYQLSPETRMKAKLLTLKSG